MKLLFAGLIVAVSLSTCAQTNPQPVSPEWTYELGSAGIPQADMTVKVGDGPEQTGKYVAIYHRTTDGTSWPAVMSVYSSGYMRLTPAYAKPVPFGTSIVLGPSYRSGGQYYHNLQVKSVTVEGNMASDDRLTMVVVGTVGALDVSSTIVVERPTTAGIRCLVSSRAKWREDTAIDQVALAKHEGFKVMQFSSMYNDGNYHDADFVHYQGQTGYVKSQLLNSDGFILHDQLPLQEPWLELGHSDAEGWQGATPTLRITMTDPATASAFTPCGWVTASTDENNDNVGLWLHWDEVASGYHFGDELAFDYVIEAVEQPRDPK